MKLETDEKLDPELEIPAISKLATGPRFELSVKTLSIFFVLLASTVLTTWWIGGFWFSISLLLILGVHEFGHYWACKRNDIDASLPHFLPAPPIFIAGTFGAFIMIKEPISNKRALMEIGASGPLAGFVAAVIVMIVGLSLSSVSTFTGFGYQFGDSLILVILSKLVMGVTPFSTEVTIWLHPVAFAGWLGMFFTALNLLPLGQLDGGHVVYSMFDSRHALIARLFFVSLLGLGFYWSGWWIWAVFVLVMGLNHPPVLDESIALLPAHKILGWLSILVLVLTFIPVPFDLIR